MGEQFGDRMLAGAPLVDGGVDNRGVLECGTIPETASTIATTIGGRTISGASLVSSPTPRALGVLSEESSEWLLPVARQAPEVQRLLDSLEQRLRAEVLRVQQRADLQLRELDHKLTAQVAAQARRSDVLDAQVGHFGRPGSGEIDKRIHSLEREGDDLCDRLKQTSLALINFNDRIGAVEAKVAAPCSPARSLGATSPLPVLGERLPCPGSGGFLPSTGSSLSGREAQDIRAEVVERIDRERSERVAGTEEVRQVAHENQAKIIETKEQLSLLARRFKGQERDHEDLREMQERFFLDARTALAASVSVAPAPAAPPRPQGFDRQAAGNWDAGRWPA